MMKVSLCAITNYYLDSEYIEEFCEYYFNLGFDNIYLMDDLKYQEHKLSDIPYISKCIDENKIIYIPRYDHPNQHGLYDAFYKEHCNEFDWCAFFDVDEFLVLNKHNNIKEFLDDDSLNFKHNADCITFCWKIFGDSGYTKKQKKVFGTYTEVSDALPYPGVNMIENKIIVRGGLENVKFFIGHIALNNDDFTRAIFCDGTPHARTYNTNYVMYAFHMKDYNVAALNHYFTKSTEDFIQRKSTGRLDMPSLNYTDAFIHFKKEYFKHNKWTQEKEDMFNDKLNILKRQ